MSDDPRCCGSGTCIIDADGRCWCGQQWDGQKMAAPRRPDAEAPAPPAAGAAPAPAPRAERVRPSLRAALIGLWLALLGLAVPASAGELAETDAQAVRAVVQAQLDAFAADDAERAFSYASGAIRAQFRDAVTFMAMVRAGYPMVVRPASTAYLRPQAEDGSVVQQVHLRDDAGRLWLATYGLERQDSGGWRINGCVVVPESGKSST